MVKNGSLKIFERQDPTIDYEADFEKVVCEVLPELYVDCHVIPFKVLLEYEGENWKPDLAIVHKKFQYWFVVEVETASHSMQKHILPQVIAFRDGTFGEQAARALAEQIKISEDQANTVINHIPRYVCVISNHEDLDWSRRLYAENIQYMSISVFKEPVQNKVTYSVYGILSPAEICIGFGTVSAHYQAIRFTRSKFWVHGSTYHINDIDGAADWLCNIVDESVWITRIRGHISYTDGKILQLLSIGSEKLYLKLL